MYSCLNWKLKINLLRSASEVHFWRYPFAFYKGTIYNCWVDQIALKQIMLTYHNCKHYLLNQLFELKYSSFFFFFSSVVQILKHVLFVLCYCDKYIQGMIGTPDFVVHINIWIIYICNKVFSLKTCK